LILALEPLLVSLIIVTVNQDEHRWASFQDEWKKEAHIVTEELAGILWLDIVEDAEHETDRLGRIDGACPVGVNFQKGGCLFLDLDHRFGWSWKESEWG
jgi:hypothetical protein